MNGNPINIETAFARMAEVPGFEGILFLSAKGTILASRFVEGVASAEAAEKFAAHLKAVEDFARTTGSQGLEELTVKGRLRNLLLLRSGRAGFLTVVLGSESMPVGLARLKMKETAYDLEMTIDDRLADRAKDRR